MKKIAIVGLLLVLSTSVASAETLKQATSNTMANIGGFFHREGERSGMSNPGAPSKHFWDLINPGPFFKQQADNYNARKAEAAAKK